MQKKRVSPNVTFGTPSFLCDVKAYLLILLLFSFHFQQTLSFPSSLIQVEDAQYSQGLTEYMPAVF